MNTALRIRVGRLDGYNASTYILFTKITDTGRKDLGIANTDLGSENRVYKFHEAV